MSMSETSMSGRQDDCRKPYMCTQCREAFPYLGDLRSHLEIHELYKCHICGHVLDTDFMFLAHLRKAHRWEKNIVCGVCSEVHKTITDIGRHMKDHPQKMPYGCGTCGKEFQCMTHIANHVKNHEVCSVVCIQGEPENEILNPYVCTICRECFPKSASLKTHSSTHKLYKCNICRQVCNTHAYFLQHLRSSHKKAVKHTCIVCKKDFRTIHQICKHMLEHPSKAPYECGICGKQFNKIGFLINHIESHTHRSMTSLEHTGPSVKPSDANLKNEPSQELCAEEMCAAATGPSLTGSNVDSPGAKTASSCPPNYQTDSSLDTAASGCGVCGMKFENLSAIGPHMKLHEPCIGENLQENETDIGTTQVAMKISFKCSFCSNSFHDVEKLLDHYESHEQPTTCECLMCGKQFAQICMFKRHVKKHAKAELYGCNICSKQYPSLAALKEHAFIHRLEAPYLCTENYNCTICGYTCNDLPVLDAHVKGHSEFNLYKCVQCGEVFSKLKAFMEHIASHEREHLFQCWYCGKRFYDMKALRSHTRAHTHPHMLHRNFWNDRNPVSLDAKKQTCAECSKTFVRYSAYCAHVKLHTQSKR